MSGDLAYWWRAGWGPRLGVLTVATCVLVIFPALLYESFQQGPRWERYKAAHHCWMRYRPGELGTPDAPSGYEAWDCGGRLIFKNPRHAGVGGQI